MKSLINLSHNEHELFRFRVRKVFNNGNLSCDKEF